MAQPLSAGIPVSEKGEYLVPEQELESDHALRLFAASGQHDDGKLIEARIASDFFAHFEPESWGSMRSRIERSPGLAATRAIRSRRPACSDIETFFVEVIAEKLDDVGIVFDGKNAFHLSLDGETTAKSRDVA